MINKNIFSQFLLFWVIGTVSVSALGQQDSMSKATIAIISYADFVPDRVSANNGPVGMPDVLAGRIIEHLSNSQRFNVVERKALRRVVTGQRFGKEIQKDYLDKTLDKAIGELEKMWGGEVNATSAWSNYNDIVKDFQDLGTAVGADYLVLGNLEKNEKEVKVTAIPYSESSKAYLENTTDVRLRLRVIDVESGIIKGADSIRAQMSESLFAGKESDSDLFTVYDEIATLAAAKILDITFPARIVSIDPLIISRGSNDGVKSGDRYSIQREGKEIKDSNGLVLARVKKMIGETEVNQTQNTIAFIEVKSGSDFQMGDLAELVILDSGRATTFTQTAIPLKTTSTNSSSNELPRIAVGLIKEGSTVGTPGVTEVHTPAFTDNIISRLAQTKRFQLIDRQEVDQLLNEQLAQAIAADQDMPSAMGSLKGADYLVYGNLASFSEKESSTKLPGSDRIFTQRLGQASGNMRILDAHTGDVIESQKILVEELLPLDSSEQEVIDRLADVYAEQVVLMLMNALYPIKVAHVSADGQIYINRGSDGGLSTDEELLIYKPGQKILDPDTGVELGVEEEYLGKLKVTEVEPARSKGLQVEGSGIARGDLLKRSAENKGNRASDSNSITRNQPARSGGKTSQKPEFKEGVLLKPTVAMGLVKLNQSAQTSNGFSSDHLKQITDLMINDLSNSNRFTMMERQEVDQVLDEKTFEAIASGGDIKSRIEQLAGADYLLHGEVTNFYINAVNKKVPYLNESTITATANAEGIFRIVDVHTGEVIASDVVGIHRKLERVKDMTQVMSELVNQLAGDAVTKITLRLYPLKVLGTSSDGTVYLNHGRDLGIKKGAQYQVMRPGQALIDPDTGASYGMAERAVATLNVTSVEDGRSRAALESGLEPENGDVLRALIRARSEPVPKVKKPNW